MRNGRKRSRLLQRLTLEEKVGRKGFGAGKSRKSSGGEPEKGLPGLLATARWDVLEGSKVEGKILLQVGKRCYSVRRAERGKVSTQVESKEQGARRLGNEKLRSRQSGLS